MHKLFHLFLFFLSLGSALSAQCTNEIELTILDVRCILNEDTDEQEYYADIIASQSNSGTSFYDFFAGSPAITGQHPYDLVHTIGPLQGVNNVLVVTISDGQNSQCTDGKVRNLTNLECAVPTCLDAELSLDIEQETICPGETIIYESPSPNIFNVQGFQVVEQLATQPFTEGSSFFGTVGGRAPAHNYNTPNTWYYVRLAYTLVTQAGPQYDFPCTLYSPVDSFYVGGTDLSHLTGAYDLRSPAENCRRRRIEGVWK